MSLSNGATLQLPGKDARCRTEGTRLPPKGGKRRVRAICSPLLTHVPTLSPGIQLHGQPTGGIVLRGGSAFVSREKLTSGLADVAGSGIKACPPEAGSALQGRVEVQDDCTRTIPTDYAL